MSDELKIVLEDVKEKFDFVIKAVNGVNERFDRHEAAQKQRLEKIEKRAEEIEDGMVLLQRDFNDHRQNTEVHPVKRKKKAL